MIVTKFQYQRINNDLSIKFNPNFRKHMHILNFKPSRSKALNKFILAVQNTTKLFASLFSAEFSRTNISQCINTLHFNLEEHNLL